MTELTGKLLTWYFQNKADIDALKEDQYVLEFEERLKDLVKVGTHVWAKPEVQKLYKSLKAQFPVQEEKPLFNASVKSANPLDAKGDQR